MHATYETFIAVSGLLDEQFQILCIGCRSATPEPGCDHCEACLNRLNGVTA